MSTVLITGASKRIGASMALFLAKKGYDIALHYHRSGKDAIVLRDKILALDVTCVVFQTDLRDALA